MADSELLTNSTSPVAVGKATLKKIMPRESMLNENTMDESTMEMSIREVKEIKKPTTVRTLDRN